MTRLADDAAEIARRLKEIQAEEARQLAKALEERRKQGEVDNKAPPKAPTVW